MLVPKIEVITISIDLNVIIWWCFTSINVPYEMISSFHCFVGSKKARNKSTSYICFTDMMQSL